MESRRERTVSILCVLFISLLCCVTLSIAKAEYKSDPQSAWDLLEDDGVLDLISGGSMSFKNKLHDVMFSKNTKIGGTHFQGKNGQCWGYGQAAMKAFSFNGCPGNRTNDSSGLRGSDTFSYDSFIQHGIPQRGVTLIRTGSTSLIYEGTNCVDYNNSGGDNYGHSMVLLYYNQSHVYYLDGNTGSPGCHKLWKRTWQDWTKTQLTTRGRLIKYAVVINNTTFQNKYPDIYTVINRDEGYYTVKGISLDPTVSGTGFKKESSYSGGSQITLYSMPSKKNATTSKKSVNSIFHVVELVKNQAKEEWYKLDDGTFVPKSQLTYQYKIKEINKVKYTAKTYTQWGKAPFDAKGKGTAIKSGSDVVVAMSVENKYGSIWYQLDSKTSGKWAYSGHFKKKADIIEIDFKDVVYPKTFRINTSQGWYLEGGKVTSDRGLKQITTKIIDADGKVISKERTVSISGYSYSIKNLDTKTSSDNGVKFSKITKEGTYYWVLKATDKDGKSNTIKLKITAKKTGSTQTGKESKKYSGSNTSSSPSTPDTPQTSSATTLRFVDVVYPSTFKINTSQGWYLQGGKVESNVDLVSISTKIVNSSGTVISGEKTRTISGKKTYTIKELDTFENGDNGVKFSKIKSAGNYKWILTAKDKNGRTLKLEMPIKAVSTGSTSTSKKSATYQQTTTAVTLKFVDVVYPSTFKINTSKGWYLAGGKVESSVGLASISTKIVNSSGAIVSGEKTRNISGKTYTIKDLDTFENGDNGVKFSKIKTAGNYKWILTVKDKEGHSLKLEMPIKAVSTGSTVTSKKSTAYNGTSAANTKGNTAVVKDEKQPEPTKAPATVKIEIDELNYRINKEKKTATFTGCQNKDAASVTIPSTIEYKGKTYEVTKIAKNACKDMKNLTKLTIGKNVTGIEADAFRGCGKLKTINIKSTRLTADKVDKTAFKGIDKNVTVNCPSKKLEEYQKFLVKKGISKTATFK